MKTFDVKTAISVEANDHEEATAIVALAIKNANRALIDTRKKQRLELEEISVKGTGER